VFWPYLSLLSSDPTLIGPGTITARIVLDSPLLTLTVAPVRRSGRYGRLFVAGRQVEFGPRGGVVCGCPGVRTEAESAPTVAGAGAQAGLGVQEPQPHSNQELRRPQGRFSARARFAFWVRSARPRPRTLPRSFILCRSKESGSILLLARLSSPGLYRGDYAHFREN